MKFIIHGRIGQGKETFGLAEKYVATALTRAMRDTGKAAAAAGNERIHAAGFSHSKWNLRTINYPKGNEISLSPEVWIHSRVNFEDVFEEGKSIIANTWLWLPLPSVPNWPGDSTRQMSPKKYVSTVGPLISFRGRDGKTPILAAKVSGGQKAQPWGSFVTRARLRKHGIGPGKSWYVQLFIGVKVVTIEKRFDTKSAMEAAVAENLPTLYKQYLPDIKV